MRGWLYFTNGFASFVFCIDCAASETAKSIKAGMRKGIELLQVKRKDIPPERRRKVFFGELHGSSS
jgi:hypothetical protein